MQESMRGRIKILFKNINQQDWSGYNKYDNFGTSLKFEFYFEISVEVNFFKTNNKARIV